MAGRLTPRNALVFPSGFRKPVKPVVDRFDPLSRGLIGCYLLGANPGAIIDISPNANNGTYGNTPTAAPSHHGGMATNFVAASSQYGTISNFSSNGSRLLTVSFWMNATFGSGDGLFMELSPNAGSNANSFFIDPNSGGFPGNWEILLGGFTAGQFLDVTFAKPSAGVWHHYVVAMDNTGGSTISVWVDGVAQSLTQRANTNVLSATFGPYTLNLMCRNAGSLFCDGTIEGLRIYNRALSPSEVVRLFAEPYAGIYSAGSSNLVGGIAADITVALTGVAATAAVGSIGVQFTLSPTGVSGTGSPGNVTPTQGLTGVAGAGQIGSVTPSTTLTPTGVQATSQAGDVSPGQGLSGNQGSGQVGTPGVSVSLALGGVAATGQVGSVIYSATGDIVLAISGVAATGQAGTVTPTGGSLGLDGHDPGLRKRRKKQEEQRQNEFAAERAKREERRGKVIDAFERVIEGKPEIPAVFVDSVVEVIEEVAHQRDIEPDFQQLLENTATLQRLWDEFIERDDEEVLALL